MKNDGPVRIKRILVQIAAVGLSVQALCAAGQQAADKTAKTPEFDVVTIRPSDRPDRGGAWGVSKNEYFARNTPLAYIILQAYFGAQHASQDRLKGAPNWVTDDRYFLTAKADDATADSWKGLPQSKQIAIAAPMLRTMLEERCKLVAHTVPTEIQGYELVRGKHPERLKEWQPDEPQPKGRYGTIGDGTSGGEWMITFSEPDDPTPSTGLLKITMAQLVDFESLNGTPIIDHTGLTGRYDLKLPRLWTPPPPPPPTEGSAAPSQPIMPPDAAHMFDWQAAGLEMRPIKVPSFNLVIDHIERPSEN
jgi:uncharacterized protein (TIGR03435 family)